MAIARVILLTIGLATLLTMVAFRGMGEHDFLFVHDEFLVLNLWDAYDVFFLFDDDNFGSFNATAVLVNFFDRIFYYVTLSLGIDFSLIQRWLYFFKIVILFLLPLTGFIQLHKLFGEEKMNRIWVYGISLWYAGNTYTLIYWNNNAFPLTLLVCYALGPLAVYTLHRAIFDTANSFQKSLLAATVLFGMSFALPLFLAFGVFFLVYVIFFFLLELRSGKHQSVQYSKMVFKNSAQLVVVVLPVLLHYGFLGYGMVATAPPTMNLSGGETFGSLRGGILYQFLQWFSWGIYTSWKPKSIFSFASYFTEWYSLAAPFCVYAVLASGRFINNLRNKAFLSIFGAGLVMFLFVKGGQPPFGTLYLFLLEHLPVFRVFRSPDTKFGFVIMLALSILLLFSYQESRRRVLTVVLCCVMLIQASLFFSGVAIRGENTKNSFDRILQVPQAYWEVAQFLNNPERTYGSIAMFPTDEFGLFRLNDGDQYIGQDLLPKLVQLPFVRVSENGSLPTAVFRDLDQNLVGGTVLQKYPLRYYIMRNDIGSVPNDFSLGGENFPLIFQNFTFRVYENLLAPALFEVRGARLVQFEKVSPVEYRVVVSGYQSEFQLIQHMNFHRGWGLYVEDNHSSFVPRLFRPDLARASDILEDASVNTWLVKREAIDQNREEVVLTVYFFPQGVFFGSLVITGVFLFGYGLFLWRFSKRNLLSKSSL